MTPTERELLAALEKLVAAYDARPLAKTASWLQDPAQTAHVAWRAALDAIAKARGT